MEDAFDILTEKLKSTGMNEYEIGCLLARFLEEDAFDYVQFMVTEMKGEELEESHTKYLS